MNAGTKHEAKVYSHHGEDGVIAWLVGKGRKGRVAVEIGAGDGVECNTRALAEQGWRVVQFDSEPARPGVIAAHVDRDNVVELLKAHSADEPYLISVDVDGIDFYILHALLSAGARPAVIVAEYNASAGEDDRVVAYDRDLRWDGSDYYGASFTAMQTLMLAFGYMVVHAESHGINLFAVRKDKWRPAHGRGGYVPRLLGSYPADSLRRPWTSAAAILGRQ